MIGRNKSTTWPRDVKGKATQLVGFRPAWIAITIHGPPVKWPSYEVRVSGSVSG